MDHQRASQTYLFIAISNRAIISVWTYGCFILRLTIMADSERLKLLSRQLRLSYRRDSVITLAIPVEGMCTQINMVSLDSKRQHFNLNTFNADFNFILIVRFVLLIFIDSHSVESFSATDTRLSHLEALMSKIDLTK